MPSLEPQLEPQFGVFIWIWGDLGKYSAPAEYWAGGVQLEDGVGIIPMGPGAPALARGAAPR